MEKKFHESGGNDPRPAGCPFSDYEGCVDPLQEDVAGKLEGFYKSESKEDSLDLLIVNQCDALYSESE